MVARLRFSSREYHSAKRLTARRRNIPRIQELFASIADHSEEKVLKHYLAYDCLLIDELGYIEVEPIQVGLFFTLLQ